jgi:hypothetical protein
MGCGGRFGDARRAALRRTAKSCGPDAPTLASSRRSYPPMTGAKEPGPRGEHEISRKTIAQGRPDDPAPPVVLPRATFYARGPRVRAGTRSSLRPRYFEGQRRINSRRARRLRARTACLASPTLSRHPGESRHP